MALSAGSVTIDDDGAETKSGAAGRLYDLMLARATAQLLEFQQPLPGGPDGAKMKRGIAAIASDFATWMVTEITGHATAVVSTSDVGLQRMPSSVAEDTPTKAPASDKFLAIV